MNCSARLVSGVILAAAFTASLPAQSIFGTLTGIISDPTNAVVAGAKIVLRDEQSKVTRDTVANHDGFYTFISVQPASYQVIVESPGFAKYQENRVVINGGDKINVNITLKVGTTSDTVEVTANSDLAPVDSGEKSFRLTTKELDNFVQVGSNAAEFLKIMPGFAISNGTSNSASFDGQNIGINGNGNGGNQSPLNGAYSYNGLPGNSLDITADGAHVSDPGCNCATPVNPNSKMISEFKVTMSNFNAESQKGPGVISSVAKGGGSAFHGSVYFDARNSVLNANDWLSNYSAVKRPDNAYYYPGFNIGGPVLLPFTRFNKNRNKLFFFSGYQYFYQVQDTGLLRATVPTLGERDGNFSPDELAKEGRITASGSAPGQINAKGLAVYPGGIIPPSAIDRNTQALIKLYPTPNADPNSNGGYNWVDDLTFTQPNVQWLSRVDYSISENTKMFVRYNYQRETQPFPIGLWSATKLQQVPLTTPVIGKNLSNSVTASLTHVFNPTMTNEFVFGYSFIGFPNTFEDFSKVDRTKVGYNYKGLFKNGILQIPNIAASGEVAGLGTYGGFELGSRGLYADKWLPTVSDTVSKVWGTHTLKAGFFWEHIRNSQPNNANVQGQLSVTVGNSNSIGNPYADLLIGNLNSYNETSFNRVNDISYATYEGFLQDSWKVTKRLSLDLGIRITHFQPWVDNLDFGFSVFDYSKYNPSCKPLDYCGFLWNKRDPSVPNGGFPTRAAYYQPRFGVAFDVFGTGKTVIRGGWGRYYYHSSQFTTGLNVSAGTQTVTLTNNQGTGGNTPLLANEIDSLNFSSTALSTGAVDRKDDKSPYTDSYSFTISQRVPGSGLMEFSYVGNQSKDLLNTSGGAGSNLNLIPVGTLLSSNNNGVDPNSLTTNNFRPLSGFADVSLATHNLYANYNALQVTYARVKGRAVISANYTFGKALGIISPTIDSFNLANDYGVQAGNRTHIFNTAYSYNLGSFLRNKLVGGAINGWQLSGIVQFQSGANLPGQRQPNFGLVTNSYKIPGTTYNVSNSSILGTNAIALQPVLTCDPSINLAEHQYINSSCFALPTQIGQNGPNVLHAIYGPAFFNSDLAIFKNFSVTEKSKLQFRINAFNFLNHPLWSFPASANLALGFNGTTGAVSTPLFGYTTTKQGHRIVQLAVRYTF